MIEIKDLSKRFGEFFAVNGLSFTVEKGDILGFLGPNGAGKTTTMRIITGFFPPSTGYVKVDGHDVADEPLAVRRLVGYLPESVPLYTDMRVEEYLRFVGKAKGLSAREAAADAKKVMGLVDISGRARQLIKQLSKGFRQRVGLAQAMMADPPILILDEPSIGLDPTQIVEIRGLIQSFAAKKTVILSSHILPEVSATCNRVIIINKGRLVAQGSPQMLGSAASGAHGIKLVCRGEAQAVKNLLSAVPGVVGVSVDSATSDGEVTYMVEADRGRETAASLATAVVEAGHGLCELTPVTASLEQVFMQLVTEEAHEEVAA